MNESQIIDKLFKDIKAKNRRINKLETEISLLKEQNAFMRSHMKLRGRLSQVIESLEVATKKISDNSEFSKKQQEIIFDLNNKLKCTS